MSHKHHSDGYMIYGCNDCGKGFKMYLETGLEGKDPNRKPVPFSIQCPFCKGFSCYDVGFRKFPIDPPIKLTKKMPYFANIDGDECGKPMNMECAVAEYSKRSRES